MKNIVLSILILINTLSLFAQEKNTDSSVFTGSYLGQEPPRKTPVMFAPGLVSTRVNTDFSSSFSPDGSEFYFSRRKTGGSNQIMVSKIANNIWSKPVRVSFIKHHDASEAHISPDGKYIFFGSREMETSNSTVWFSVRKDSLWGVPKKLGEDMMYATISLKNQLYYTDKSGGNISKALLFTAKFIEEELIEIIEVSIPNESGMGRAHPYISPDESFLIFDQMGELFVTFLRNDQTWSPSKKLNSEINTSAYEFAAHLSADGKYLFFTRDDNIYWVDAKIIEELRPQ